MKPTTTLIGLLITCIVVYCGMSSLGKLLSKMDSLLSVTLICMGVFFALMGLLWLLK